MQLSPRPLDALNARFPIYGLRAYDFIEPFEEFIIISTKHREYILDCPKLDGDYAQRRLTLVGCSQDLEFKLYPLNERYTSMGQLANTKRRHFIDADGKVWRYRPTKFYRVEYFKVLRTEKTWNGKYRLTTKLPVTFVTEEVKPYVGVIKFGAGYHLFDLSDTKKAPTRKKL